MFSSSTYHEVRAIGKEWDDFHKFIIDFVYRLREATKSNNLKRKADTNRQIYLMKIYIRGLWWGFLKLFIKRIQKVSG